MALRLNSLDRKCDRRPSVVMETFFLLGLLVAGGYVLGIIGFFRANTAHKQLAVLRRALADLAAGLHRRPVRFPAPPRTTARRIPSPPGRGVRRARRAAGSTGDAVPETTVPVAVQTPAMADRVEPPPMPPAEPVASRPAARRVPKSGLDLEDLLTARWGVWLGSAALLLAGVFLIRYAVERELLGPGARCVLAGLLGGALLAAAEFLSRHEPPSIPGPFRADQAPAALAAGGTAALFGAAYGAGPFYGILTPFLAFWAMAAASFIGLLAALRHGPPTAAVGIVGAFATPALVSVENPSYPGLFAYLALVSAAALAVVRYTAWTWLGWATTIAGAIWV